ncbi:hypothetical protein ACTQ5X_06670 [Jeotgalibaca porci]|uniref:hypothetical protein n=1 Tax=Jeotgalibaca porci TaxID=1868793 RepID=UPI003F9227D4
MAKPILKSQQSLVDAEKVIQLANDIVAGKIKNLDGIKDEDLQQIVKDGIEYQRDNINSVGSAALGSMGILGGVEIANQAIKYSPNTGAKGATIITSGLKNMGKKIGIPSMKGGLLAGVIITIGLGSATYILAKVFIPPMNKTKKEELLLESEKVLEQLSAKVSDERTNNLEFILVIKLMVNNIVTYLKNDLGIA